MVLEQFTEVHFAFKVALRAEDEVTEDAGIDIPIDDKLLRNTILKLSLLKMIFEGIFTPCPHADISAHNLPTMAKKLYGKLWSDFNFFTRKTAHNALFIT